MSTGVTLDRAEFIATLEIFAKHQGYIIVTEKGYVGHQGPTGENVKIYSRPGVVHAEYFLDDNEPLATDAGICLKRLFGHFHVWPDNFKNWYRTNILIPSFKAAAVDIATILSRSPTAHPGTKLKWDANEYKNLGVAFRLAGIAFAKYRRRMFMPMQPQHVVAAIERYFEHRYNFEQVEHSNPRQRWNRDIVGKLANNDSEPNPAVSTPLEQADQQIRTNLVNTMARALAPLAFEKS